MFIIGICDDDQIIRMQQMKLCQVIISKITKSYKIIGFCSAEEVLTYLEREEESQIDFLLLDIEMDGMNGLQLRDRLIHDSRVWRIVFATSHLESMNEAFGLKTIGFISKPVSQEILEKKLQGVYKEKMERYCLKIRENDKVKGIYRLDSILYFEADGNFTKVYYQDKESEGVNIKYDLLSIKLGDVEKQIDGQDIVRIHKSYMVNLAQVKDMSDKVTFLNCDTKIPVGRTYKEEVKKLYMQYIVKNMRERV